jgi:hypothetical protein
MPTIPELHAKILTFVNGHDRSKELAGEIEVALDELFGDAEPYYSLSLALVSYRPEGGEYHYGEQDIVKMIASILPVIDAAHGQ